jgi:hypothetical protein
MLYPKSVLWATQPPTFIGGAVLDVAPELRKQIAILGSQITLGSTGMLHAFRSHSGM